MRRRWVRSLSCSPRPRRGPGQRLLAWTGRLRPRPPPRQDRTRASGVRSGGGARRPRAAGRGGQRPGRGPAARNGSSSVAPTVTTGRTLRSRSRRHGRGVV